MNLKTAVGRSQFIGAAQHAGADRLSVEHPGGRRAYLAGKAGANLDA